MQKSIEAIRTFHQDAGRQFRTAIAAAFAFVIALSWNEAMKSLILKINESLGLEGETLWLKVLAAVFTTVICIIGIKYVSEVKNASQ